MLSNVYVFFNLEIGIDMSYIIFNMIKNLIQSLYVVQKNLHATTMRIGSLIVKEHKLTLDNFSGRIHLLSI